MTPPPRRLTVPEVIELHAALLKRHGGSAGLRDRGLLESAVSQPAASFGGRALYPTLFEQAAAIGFSLVSNHPFVDGNKRIGLTALDVHLRFNGYKLEADADDAEATILALAEGTLSREELAAWIGAHAVPAPPP